MKFLPKNISDKIILNKQVLGIFYTFQNGINEAYCLIIVFLKCSPSEKKIIPKISGNTVIFVGQATVHGRFSPL